MAIHVDGWAFKAPEAREQAVQAFLEALDLLGIERPEVREDGGMTFTRETDDKLRDLRIDQRPGYANFSVTLNTGQVQLTSQQKVLITDDGNGCFGGRIEGSRVFVYTD